MHVPVSKSRCMMELTTGHYDKDFDPNPVLLLQAAKAAAPVLPRQIKQQPAPNTRKERIPLCSSLHGAAGGVCTTEQQHQRVCSPSRLCTVQVQAGQVPTPHWLAAMAANTSAKCLLAGHTGQGSSMSRCVGLLCAASQAQHSALIKEVCQALRPALLDHPGVREQVSRTGRRSHLP